MRFDYMIFFPGRQMGNSLSESVGNYAKEGGSKSRARRPPLHSSQRARLENRGAYVRLLRRDHMVFRVSYGNLVSKANIRNPLLLLANERSHFAHLKQQNAYSAFNLSL